MVGLEKHSLKLNFGSRELEIFNKIKEDFKGLTNVSDNRNEIVRRGLQSFRYLSEIDDTLLLKVLSSNLKELQNKFDNKRFEFANDLTIVIYATMICRKGVSESELFEPIVLNMKLINDFTKSHELDGPIKQKVHDLIDHITKSIDIIFLRDVDLGLKFQQLESYYEESRKGKRLEGGPRIFMGIMAIPNADSTEFEPFSSLVATVEHGQETTGKPHEISTSSNRLALIQRQKVS
jgi:hypothetical protein